MPRQQFNSLCKISLFIDFKLVRRESDRKLGIQALGKGLMDTISSNNIKVSPIVLIDLLLLLQTLYVCIIGNFQPDNQLVGWVTSVNNYDVCITNLLAQQDTQATNNTNFIANAIIVYARSTNKSQLENFINRQMKTVIWQESSNRQQGNYFNLASQLI